MRYVVFERDPRLPAFTLQAIIRLPVTAPVIFHNDHRSKTAATIVTRPRMIAANEIVKMIVSIAKLVSAITFSFLDSTFPAHDVPGRRMIGERRIVCKGPFLAYHDPAAKRDLFGIDPKMRNETHFP